MREARISENPSPLISGEPSGLPSLFPLGSGLRMGPPELLPNRNFQKLFFVSAVATVILPTIWLSMRWAAPTEELLIDDRALDLGELWISDDPYSHSVPLTNASSEVLAVSDVITSCSCTKVEPKSLSIPPGESATLNILIDVLPKTASELQAEKRDVNILISPLVTSPNSKARLTYRLHGTVRQAYRLASRVVDFGSELAWHSQLPTQELVVQCDPSIHALHVVPHVKGVTASVSRLSTSSNTFKIVLVPDVTFTNTLGAISGALEIYGVNARGDRLPSRNCTLVGIVVDDITAIPEGIQLGPMPRGSIAHRTLSLRSRSRSQFQVLSCTSKLPGTTASYEPEAGILEVASMALAEGGQSGTLTVNCQLQGRAEPVIVNVPVRYFGYDSSRK
jgi:hypothetical protein